MVGTPAAMSAADTAIVNRLTGLGLTVTVADDDSVQASAATGKSVVLISASVLPDKIGSKFAGTAVPLVTWEGGLYDDLGMTGSVLGTDLGESVSKKKITILLPSHPIAAGRSGTIIAVDPGAKLMWGRPSASGVIVAHVGDFPALPAVFAYETGREHGGRGGSGPSSRTVLECDHRTDADGGWMGDLRRRRELGSGLTDDRDSGGVSCHPHAFDRTANSTAAA